MLLPIYLWIVFNCVKILRKTNIEKWNNGLALVIALFIVTNLYFLYDNYTHDLTFLLVHNGLWLLWLIVSMAILSFGHFGHRSNQLVKGS